MFQVIVIFFFVHRLVITNNESIQQINENSDSVCVTRVRQKTFGAVDGLSYHWNDRVIFFQVSISYSFLCDCFVVSMIPFSRHKCYGARFTLSAFFLLLTIVDGEFIHPIVARCCNFCLTLKRFESFRNHKMWYFSVQFIWKTWSCKKVYIAWITQIFEVFDVISTFRKKKHTHTP